jgi:hypothetical protein
MSRRISKNNLSRRAFASVAVTGTIAASAQQNRRADEKQSAEQRRASAVGAIAGFAVPMSTEPGFIFRP